MTDLFFAALIVGWSVVVMVFCVNPNVRRSLDE
jgi:hypothetical protein